MAITKDMILRAVEGKAAERLLESERRGDIVLIRYPAPQGDREDNLHKQAVRGLVQRMAPDWKVHINSLGEGGFTVEVRPKPSVEPETAAERPPLDLTDDGVERLEELIREIQETVAAMRSG